MSPTPPNLPSTDACSAARLVLDRVGDKWSVFTIGVLGRGPMRFNELRRAIEGISQRMLTRTLRGLERDGLVRRTVYPTVPVQVEYALTPLGKGLIGPANDLIAWAIDNESSVLDARAAFDEQQSVEPS